MDWFKRTKAKTHAGSWHYSGLPNGIGKKGKYKVDGIVSGMLRPGRAGDATNKFYNKCM